MPDARVYIASFLFGADTAADEGVRTYDLDASSGALELAGQTGAGSEALLSIAADPAGRFLYAAGCRSSWQDGGALLAYAIDPESGALRHLNTVSSEGVIPVFVSVSVSGRHVLAANCGPFQPGSEGRTVVVYAVEPDGSLGRRTALQQHEGASVDPERQTSPHPHCVVLDPANRHAVVPDLGTDEIRVYRFDDDSGALEPHAVVKVAAGSGPRHFRFHPSGRFGYLNTEIANTVIAYAYDPDAGQLTELQTLSTLPPDSNVEDRNAAELQVHPSGRFLYSSNRVTKTIAGFAIDIDSGKLTPAGITTTGGAFPRGFALDPSGDFLVVGNERSNSLFCFRVHPKTGALTPAGDSLPMPAPACVSFVP